VKFYEAQNNIGKRRWCCSTGPTRVCYALLLPQHSTDDLTVSNSMDVHFHSCDHIYYYLYIPVIHPLVNKSWQLSL